MQSSRPHPYQRIPSGPRFPAPTAVRPVPVSPVVKSGSSLLCSNLPTDVTLRDVQDLFSQTIGTLTDCKLVYDDCGESLGIALVSFVALDHATLAFKQYNGKMIDKTRPLKISLIYDVLPQQVNPPAVSSSTNFANGPRDVPTQPSSYPQQRQQPHAPRVGNARGNDQATKLAPGQQLLARLAPLPLTNRLGPQVEAVGAETSGGATRGGRKGGKRRGGGRGAGNGGVSKMKVDG